MPSQGEMGDRLTQQGRLDLIAKVIEHAQKNGLIAGVGLCGFQVREDAIIANKVLTNLTRPRPWRG